MVLPSNFSHSEHFQDVTRRRLNRRVREWFSDLGGEDWEENLGSTRAQARIACTHREDDSLLLTVGKLLLFQIEIGQAADFQPLAVLFPEGDDIVTRKFKPQIQLFFQEDEVDADPDYRPVRGQITYRLTDEDSTTITQARLTQIANNVRTNFGINNGFIWRKGKDSATYFDKENGYQLRLLVRNQADARELVRRVLATRGDTPNFEFFQYTQAAEPEQRYPTVPETFVALGKTRRNTRQRPIVSARFRYALALISGIAQPVVLYDNSFTKQRPLIPR